MRFSHQKIFTGLSLDQIQMKFMYLSNTCNYKKWWYCAVNLKSGKTTTICYLNDHFKAYVLSENLIAHKHKRINQSLFISEKSFWDND